MAWVGWVRPRGQEWHAVAAGEEERLVEKRLLAWRGTDYPHPCLDRVLVAAGVHPLELPPAPWEETGERGGAAVTEVEYLASDDPAALLRFLTTLDLFRCRVCGNLWERLADGNWTFLPGQTLRACCDNVPMSLAAVDLPGRRISERKLRLFACACWRLLWGAPQPAWKEEPDPFVWSVVEQAEHQADGLPHHHTHSYYWVTLPCAVEATRQALSTATPRVPAALQAALLRDLCGNPFCRVTMTPPHLLPWWDGGATHMARRIYQERDFAALPVLADALEDAGCTQESLLLHLRGEGPHARGCWALDLVLGKGEE